MFLVCKFDSLILKTKKPTKNSGLFFAMNDLAAVESTTAWVKDDRAKH